ncbi:MAG: oligosaccharide flippase family protein [Candidatus Micrarchaeota archaeon]|nr:oligosaccharide flippase family protein [Candidatus Micrarchaeota archaeon]
MPDKTSKDKQSHTDSDAIIGAKTAGVASLMSFGRFVALFLSGIAFIIVARVLGPSVYGIYTLAIAYSGFFTAGLADLGISTAFSKFIGQYSGKGNKTEIERIMSNGYAVAIVSGLILTIVALMLGNVVAVYELKDASLTYVVQIVSFAVILGMLFNISYNALVGFGKGIYIAIAIIIQSLFQAIASIALAILGYEALAPIIGLLIGYISAIIFAFIMFNLKFGIRFRMPSLAYMKKLVNFSYPIAVYNSVRGFVSNLSPIVLGLFVTIAIVGNFGVALRTSAIISNITDALGLAVLPMFAYTASTKGIGDRIGKFYNYSLYLTYVLVTPVLLYITILSKQFSYTVFSAKYAIAPVFISIISIGTLLWILATFTIMLLIGTNRVKTLLKYSLIVEAIEVLLLFVVVPLFGGVGLSILLYIITPTLMIILMTRAASRLIKVRPDIAKLARVFLAGLVSMAFLAPLLLLLKDNYIAILVLGALEQIAIYPIILALTGAANRKELKVLKDVTGSIPLLNAVMHALTRYSGYFARE